MTEVRGTPADRIIARDIGYDDSFKVLIWMAQRGKRPMYVPNYQRATEKHRVKNCGLNPLR